MADAIVRPFHDYLGIEVVDPARGMIRLPWRHELSNSRGQPHGGAVSALLDMAMSVAGREALGDGSGVSTIQFSVHFLAPGEGDLMTQARCVRVGKTVVTIEGSATDSQGTLVAQALGSWRVIRRRG